MTLFAFNYPQSLYLLQVGDHNLSRQRWETVCILLAVAYVRVLWGPPDQRLLSPKGYQVFVFHCSLQI